jgi:hypothetical protein
MGVHFIRSSITKCSRDHWFRAVSPDSATVVLRAEAVMSNSDKSAFGTTLRHDQDVRVCGIMSTSTFCNFTTSVSAMHRPNLLPIDSVREPT